MPSDSLCVDAVVLLMRAQEADVEHSVGSIYPHDQPVFVAADVEDDPSVFQDAGVAKLPFYILGCRPVGLDRFAIPRHRRPLGVPVFRPAGPERFEGRHGDDAHEGTVVPYWDHVKSAVASLQFLRGEALWYYPSLRSLRASRKPPSGDRTRGARRVCAG